ncbi:SDR family oxidoreductase [Antarcticibacterium flavum]|uniref:SDR family oxidoreductase n=1 Tax=Antarcticibacterium flavum TaxID=2058175 RepID=A0A5B7X1H7_9FLAO|nr:MULTISPECIES: SDR family oxidoreductase [Antarcticibacterium]MCM4161145.1 NAD-dependent dehydratase [Antarcticibacterium sp. W02-3]QCY69356.1 SDR family oxidoreductase [Antarcticibacterium flavum]
MEKILIVGATGDTGMRIVEILNNSQSFEPVAMIRKEEQKGVFEDMDVQWVLANLEENVDHALKGIDKVIFAAGSGGDTGEEKTIAVDQKGAIRVIDAAKKAKVKKFVMLSSMGADDPSQHKKLQVYLEAKQKADEHLMDSGIPYTILRPGALTDDLGFAKVKLAEKLDEQGEISRDDVAFLLVMSLADPLVKNKVIEALEGEEPIKSALIEASK